MVCLSATPVLRDLNRKGGQSYNYGSDTCALYDI